MAEKKEPVRSKNRRDWDTHSAIRRLYERGCISEKDARRLLKERTSVPNGLTKGVVEIWKENSQT